VACAVAWDRDIGVDVEHMDRRTETTAVADRFFSPSEVEALRRLPPSEQRRRFFELWTLKEAYIKARGLGLAIPLESFSFSFYERAPPGIGFAESLPDDPRTWRFEQTFPSDAHAMALAARAAPGESLRIGVEWTALG
jgi:4'-phosphopantetheinyl transferase